MKSNYLIALITLVSSILTAQDKVPSNGEMDSILRDYVWEKDKLMEPVRKLNSQYIKHLTALLDRATEAGDLDKTLTIQSEIEILSKGIAYGEPNLKYPDLTKMREIYSSEKGKLVSEYSESALKIANKYKELLVANQRELTRQKRIDDAVKIREKLKTLDLEIETLKSEEPPLDLMAGAILDRVKQLKHELKEQGAEHFFQTENMLYAVFPKNGKGLNHNQARERAAELGGRLPIFDSEEDFETLKPFMKEVKEKLHEHHYTLGARRNSNKEIVWDSGEKMNDRVISGDDTSRVMFRIGGLSFEAYDETKHFTRPVLLLQVPLRQK